MPNKTSIDFSVLVRYVLVYSKKAKLVSIIGKARIPAETHEANAFGRVSKEISRSSGALGHVWCLTTLSISVLLIRRSDVNNVRYKMNSILLD